MSSEDRKRTKRNLVIFSLSVLGLAAVAGIVEPFTVMPGAEPGTPGLGQLLWIVAPLAALSSLVVGGSYGSLLVRKAWSA